VEENSSLTESKTGERKEMGSSSWVVVAMVRAAVGVVEEA
jgi:hypothetical protein